MRTGRGTEADAVIYHPAGIVLILPEAYEPAVKTEIIFGIGGNKKIKLRVARVLRNGKIGNEFGVFVCSPASREPDRFRPGKNLRRVLFRNVFFHSRHAPFFRTSISLPTENVNRAQDFCEHLLARYFLLFSPFFFVFLLFWRKN